MVHVKDWAGGGGQHIAGLGHDGFWMGAAYQSASQEFRLQLEGLWG